MEMGPQGGVRLVLGAMAILVAHEMGHYVACRHYRVDASLPYFIPFPGLGLIGTLGAFIRIRSPFPHRRALFDIGIAGPLAGFVVCLPVLVLGVLEAEVVPVPLDRSGVLGLGEPLAFQWAAAWLHPSVPEGMTLSLGPLGMAGWFGLLVTALNLMPVGQLDGGHVVYAMVRHRARVVSRVALGVAVVLVYLRPTWLLWAILLLVLSRPHPPTLDDHAPLGRARVLVGLLGIGVFAVCFTPHPIMISWPEFLEAFGFGGPPE